MRLQVRALQQPKAGHTLEEYEDAYATSRAGSWPYRVAIADGATESAFSGRWARLLSEAFVLTGQIAAAVPFATDSWEGEMQDEARALPWFVVQKLEEGAHATLLGLEIQSNGHFHAEAVGDGNLFHFKHNGSVAAWPFDAPEAFTNRPDLISSRDRQPVLPGRFEGHCASGESLVLATDAIAAWLLRVGAHSALTLTQDTMTRVLADAKAEGLFRNDDATLVVIEALE